MPNLDADMGSDRGCLGEPIDASRYDAVPEQLVARSNDDGTLLRPDVHNVHRLAEPAGQSTPLANGEPREAAVHADGASVGAHEGSRAQRRRVGAQTLTNDLRVIAIRHEADVLTLDLLCYDLESQAMGDSPRLGLGLPSDGKEHAR